jgi:hypothetical protein
VQAMALIYPIQADAPEPDEDSEPVFEELAADLSDTWLVQIEADDDDDGVSFGPMSAPAAFELGVELDDRRPDWTISVLPLHVPGTADDLIALFDEDDD